MSPDNIPAKPVIQKDDSQGSGSRKTASTRPAEQGLKCPRCDSPNTKFCYYNNYSLTQPRHFCKTCRRYWTNGGALRNVPIGGGCRKNKKVKSSSRLSGDSKDTVISSSEIGGLKFFHGLSPAMDFQLGGLSYPRLHPPTTVQNTTSMNIHSGLASSIESLSTINRDLHWKLQQQRLATLFGGEIQKDNSVSSVPLGIHTQKPQPIVFQNLEISKTEACGVGNSRKEGTSGDQIATEWFFGNSYGPVTTTPTNSAGNDGGNGNANSWNGTQAWSHDLQQYSALP
ncbi:hypothetical protein I3842_07G046000 [Carya illinoinensis]|uniref:Dof zinc finger protein n=1 Tax=Carya illinoinensis TaxID=32201 RepID=A0A922EFD4_CARIL|nr:hypothetical protein I3842_07G046000 [Carya illinoinensis]